MDPPRPPVCAIMLESLTSVPAAIAVCVRLTTSPHEIVASLEGSSHAVNINSRFTVSLALVTPTPISRANW